MQKLVALSVSLVVLLCAAVVSARGLGTARPMPYSMVQSHLLDCAPPCWMGIVPGVTTIKEAKAKIVAMWSGQPTLQIKDSGFADGNVAATAVENAIDGTDFYLAIRLNIATLVDGSNEKVQSIALTTPRNDRSRYAPTVGDILSTYGAPAGVIIDPLLGGGYQVTMQYPGVDVVFFAHTDRAVFSEIPRLTLTSAQGAPPSGEYRPWKGLGTLTLGH